MEPPSNLIPKNEKYRLWFEKEQLSIKPKGRKVVLRGRSNKIDEVPNILNDDYDI